MALPAINKQSFIEDNYKLVTTHEELAAVVKELESADVIAVDTETEGVEYEAIIVGICLSTRPGTGYYIPIRHEVHEGILYDEQLPPPVVYEAIGPALETKACVGHNIKFDQQMLWKDGVYCNFTDDTLAIAKLFGKYPSNGLKFLVGTEFGHKMVDLAELFPKRGNKRPEIRPAILSPREICNYAVEDANWTLQLREKYYQMKPSLERDTLYQIEMQLLPVVGEMEAFGLPVSKSFLTEQGEICQAHIQRLEQEILEDIRASLKDPEYTCKLSGKDLTKLLYEDLKLPVLKRSEKTGAPSTDKDVMKELALLNPVARRINTHRTMGKLNNTYLHGLLAKVHPDGRVRGSFNQFGTDTGRFSSSKPNLQNLPRTQTFYLWEADDPTLVGEFINCDKDYEPFPEDDEIRCRLVEDGKYEVWSAAKEKWIDTADLGVASDGKLYGLEEGVFKEMWRCPTRNFVQAPTGHYLVEADYSQIEVRILAGESGEPTLLNAYASGEDVHLATAATIFGIDKEHVTDNQRQVGKTLNFSLLYGQGAESTGVQLGISKKEAEELVDRYFENMTEIRDWIERTKDSARKLGVAYTRLNRARHFPMIHSRDNWIKTKQEREAVNFKIQGAAADVMKLALVRTASRLRKHFGDAARIVSTVHDSVLLEVSDEIPTESLVAVLRDGMTGFNSAEFTKGWPDLVIDVKKGQAWADAKEIKGLPADLPLPPLYEGEELPKVRVRQVAKEREYGLANSPTANKTEQGDIFGGLLAVVEPKQDVEWVIELAKPLTAQQLTGLTEFLGERAEKRHPDQAQYGTVKVLAPDGNGAIMEQEVSGRFVLSMQDEMALRIKVGNCVLRQSLDDIDPDEVMRGIDFGL